MITFFDQNTVITEPNKFKLDLMTKIDTFEYL